MATNAKELNTNAPATVVGGAKGGWRARLALVREAKEAKQRARGTTALSRAELDAVVDPYDPDEDAHSPATRRRLSRAAGLLGGLGRAATVAEFAEATGWNADRAGMTLLRLCRAGLASRTKVRRSYPQPQARAAVKSLERWAWSYRLTADLSGDRPGGAS